MENVAISGKIIVVISHSRSLANGSGIRSSNGQRATSNGTASAAPPAATSPSASSSAGPIAATAAAASSSSTAHRQYSSFEDQYGRLPPGWEKKN